MKEGRDELRGRLPRRLRSYGPVCLVYAVATWLTGAAFMGDTDDYVDSAVSYFNGIDYRFWEFGHLFWRPAGWLFARLLMPLTRVFVGEDLRLIFTNGFLNYAQTGCSYVPGLAFLTLGLYFLARDAGELNDSTWRTSALAG